jgi:hypothetical protein
MKTLWLLTLILRASAAHHARTSPPHEYDQAADNGTFGYYPSRTFMTEDGIIAPETNWLQWDQQCDDGNFYFLTPKGWSISQPGPMILDSRGDLVWSKHFDNEWGGQAYDLMVQHYQGQEYLTFWTGDDQIRGHGSGAYMMVSNVRSLEGHCAALASQASVVMLTFAAARFILRSNPKRGRRE